MNVVCFEQSRFLRLCAVVCQKPQRPTAPGKRLRSDAAPLGSIQGQGRGCRVPAVKRCRIGCHGQQWPGASKRDAGPQISNLGHLKKFFEIEIHEKKCIFNKCLTKL